MQKRTKWVHRGVLHVTGSGHKLIGEYRPITSDTLRLRRRRIEGRVSCAQRRRAIGARQAVNLCLREFEAFGQILKERKRFGVSEAQMPVPALASPKMVMKGAFGVLFEPASLKLDVDEDEAPEDRADVLLIRWKMHCKRRWMALLCASIEAATWALSSVSSESFQNCIASAALFASCVSTGCEKECYQNQLFY